MNQFIEIIGGTRLCGKVNVAGAKNAALPMLMAALLTDEECHFSNVPNLIDIDLTLGLLEHLGAEVSHNPGLLKVKIPSIKATEASYTLVKALRASFWVLGPLLARGHAAQVALPGGDAIGTRPVDIHLNGLAKMGADIKLKHGVVYANAASGLRPAKIDFAFPSVGATHQIMMAAALTEGTTVMRGAACEPEVSALADMLNAMGAHVEGAGTDVVAVHGRKQLGGAKVKMIGDRIEAGTYILAALITGGDITVEGFDPKHLGTFINIITDIGATLTQTPSGLRVAQSMPLKPVHIKTDPFPGIATDLQAPLMAVLSLAQGVSTIEEKIFEGRFGHVQELARMGAKIEVADRVATINGVATLSGAPVEAPDIRAGAALVIAGLAAEGTTRIYDIDHIRRGYDRLDTKLSIVGAKITSRPEELEDSIAIGC